MQYNRNKDACEHNSSLHMHMEARMQGGWLSVLKIKSINSESVYCMFAKRKTLKHLNM